jgi:hypothetical protein
LTTRDLSRTVAPQIQSKDEEMTAAIAHEKGVVSASLRAIAENQPSPAAPLYRRRRTST